MPLAAADKLAEEGISAEVIDLRWVRPLDMATIGASVKKTGRLIIAEEQWHEAGWGATVISNLTRANQQWKAIPRAVALYHDMLIPYSPPLEDEMIPSARSASSPPPARPSRASTSDPRPGGRRRPRGRRSIARR